MNMLKSLDTAKRQLLAVWKGVRRLREDATFIRDALGRIEARQCANATSMAEAEFKVTSQWGEDGIFQYLLRHVKVAQRIFVEFGVQNYTEANTRFLLTNCGWSGMVLDGSKEDIQYIRNDSIYWRYNLKAVQAFITRENINDLLSDNGLTGEIGLLSVDIDGVDYWVWEAITAVAPAIVVAEYNSLFGAERAVTVPYDPAFRRSEAHFSHSYYGASLAAPVGLGKRKGYAFVGSNTAGNNAFFIRRDLLPATLRELTAAEGWVKRSFREERDREGNLTYPDFEKEAALVNSLPLVEVEK